MNVKIKQNHALVVIPDVIRMKETNKLFAFQSIMIRKYTKEAFVVYSD